MRILGELDRRLFTRVATARVPGADPALIRLSHLADHGRLWMGAATGLAALGGRSARRAALRGIGSLAIASLTVNTVVKWSARRPRPCSTPYRRCATSPVSRGPLPSPPATRPRPRRS
ncbi:hypothetical protein [Streptomyces sp. CA-106110]|uniref:hypothetical protein n=1 Tax=Streptomyces sp. CA-106110 TaxID=3240044 RepID=UPI003D8A57E9